MTRHELSLPIAVDHPAFAGHFPDAPIVPGVVLLDLALHAIGIDAGCDLSRCRLGNVKFLSPVRPGEAVSVRYETSGETFRFEIVSGERRVASGALQPVAR